VPSKRAVVRAPPFSAAKQRGRALEESCHDEAPDNQCEYRCDAVADVLYPSPVRGVYSSLLATKAASRGSMAGPFCAAGSSQPNTVAGNPSLASLHFPRPRPCRRTAFRAGFFWKQVRHAQRPRARSLWLSSVSWGSDKDDVELLLGIAAFDLQ
jgi:hypothetical protein